MFVYVKYSDVFPYLPVAVADTPKELAELIGLKPQYIHNALYRKNRTVAKVWIDVTTKNKQ